MKTILDRQAPVSLATAMDWHRQGRLDEALMMYRKILKRDQHCLDALHLIGVILCERGHFAEARKSIRKAVRFNPNFYFAWNSLGNVERSLTHQDAAAECYRRALSINPEYELAQSNLFEVYLETGQLERAEAILQDDSRIDQWFRLGLAYHSKKEYAVAERALLHLLSREPDHEHALFVYSTMMCEQNRFEESVPLFERLLRINPRHVDAWFNFSLVYQGLGDVAGCRRCLETVLGIDACYVKGWYNYGRLLDQEGDFEGAEAAYSRCIDLQPDYLDALYNRGGVYQSLARSQEAMADFRRVTDLDDAYVNAWYNWAYECFTIGDFEESENLFARVLVLQPDFVDAHYNLGNIYYAQSDFAKATAAYTRVIQLDEAYGKAWYNLGKCYVELMNLKQGEECLLKALSMNINVGDAWTNLALAYAMSGRLDCAENAYRQSAQIKGNASTYSNLLFFLTYHKYLSSAELLREHQLFEKKFKPERSFEGTEAKSWQPKDRLRVGYVSGDFCGHVVNSFFEGLITAHHRERVETFAYANVEREDAISQRLREQFDYWRPVGDLDDETVCRQIREDGIDILVDLSGHSARNRLSLFLHRLAPVQVSYLGYIATTGLSQMDYRISDFVLNDGDKEETSEEIYRLPRCYKAYTPFVGYPEVVAREPKAGAVVFGSLNRISKLSPETYDLWSEVLHALPHSSLLIYRMELKDAVVRDKVLDCFAQRGITAERIVMVSEMERIHLEGYGMMDIALDPCPIVGGATTAEALWQGVPVLTLAGDAHRSRISASLLSAVGLSDWVARTREEFVAKAVAKANDVDSLIDLRQKQREMMEASALRDFDGLASALEDAYFEMWQRLQPKG